ncbi:MAG: acetylxylan esterase, partial [Kiritimatiellae bacterium]|nr:acetylxylan esterase [Kiritimatiellia bacterium]
MKTILFATCAALMALGAGAVEPTAVPCFLGDRAKTLAMFEENVFGRRPAFPGFRPKAEVVEETALPSIGAVRKVVRLNTMTPRGETNFNCVVLAPDRKKPVPAFVFISLRPVDGVKGDLGDPGVYGQLKQPFPRIPVTNVLARGYAVAMFWHHSVFPDEKSSFDGIARSPDGWGAISAWALAASRVLDWIGTEKRIDASKVAVIGHSRGGKTALWAGATDKRFAMAISNGSGNSGARMNSLDIPGSEKIADIVRSFPYWFAPNYATRWAGKDLELPFDNHQLIALMAPRCVAVGSGAEDYWAGPQGEEYALRLASRAWYDPLKVHYHCRPGGHALSPEDWTQYMDFADFRGWTSKDDPAFDGVLLKGDTDQPDPVNYSVGETAVITVRREGALPAGTWRLKWRLDTDDGLHEEGIAPLAADGATNDVLVKRATLKRPGFARLQAEIVDARGRRVHWRAFFDGGAGFGVDAIGKATAEPADFDAYWARQKAFLASVPMKLLERKPVPADRPDVNTNCTTWAVKIACAGPRPVTGYLSIPKKPGKHPVKMFFQGYSPAETWTVGPHRWIQRDDEITFDVNAHGFDLLRDEDYYTQFNDAVGTLKHNYAFSPFENAEPENAYFNQMALRLMRACEWAKTLPEWDGKTFVVEGGSQGGLQTAWAMHLVDGVTVARPCITWGCDLGAGEHGRVRGDWHLPYVPGLEYFDAVNHAKRAKCPVEVTRAGIGDYCCPPSGLAAFYNAIPTRKSILWVQGSQHGYVPPKPNQEI